MINKKIHKVIYKMAKQIIIKRKVMQAMQKNMSHEAMKP